MLSCSQPVAQVHERLLIANASISGSQAAGMAARKAADHHRCHHALDWLPCPLVMHVLRGVECGSHAAAPAVLCARCVSRG
ncbi:MAG TPA: hypothetical protein DEF43_19280 [Chloroflexus aurantiacus]|nr:MAG: hypothetical protein D6716_11105 [Chloroflexota bacterium]HBW69248.1 hypothetical protein [Chloroflexus aurantiacus]